MRGTIAPANQRMRGTGLTSGAQAPTVHICIEAAAIARQA